MLSYTSSRPIPEEVLREKLREFLARADLRRGRLLVLIPDDTRTIPMPIIFAVLVEELLPRTKELAFLVALGTHPPMTEESLSRHLGPRFDPHEIPVFQHSWQDPKSLVRLGALSQEKMAEISQGMLALEVAVEINRLVLEYDQLLLVNPVFPHEVVGFSGGHKYFFPGVSGPTMLDISHWLGALITNPKVNGHKWTPVRKMIEEAASLVPTQRFGLSLVLKEQDVVGLFLGEVVEAWEAAADLSAEVNIVWAPRTYECVISVAPPMYTELWTAGKCMYKLEPVVADGGTLVIYGPHIREVSVTHGRWLLRIGYHVRDYFLSQWEKFKHYPWAVLAHSTHVKGIGTFRDGVERPRIQVVLATGIPEEICRKINLGYQDPASLVSEQYVGREEEGVLVVPAAGEQLWRLVSGEVPDVDFLYQKG